MASIKDVGMRGTRNLTTGRFSEVHGLVTSYDPMTYLAKVTYMPEGIQSGWLPIETGHIGQGYGIVIGLQTGQGIGGTTGNTGGGGFGAGATSGGGTPGSQGQGDQVIIRFQEGDFETGKIVQRVHSQQDTPPPAQSGEIIAWTKFKQDQSPGPDAAQQGQQNSTGQKIWFKNDGSISTEDGNGASRVMDGKGNYTVTSGNAQQQTTTIVHQVLNDKPASNSNSGIGSIGQMLAGGNIGSMLGGLLGTGGGGGSGGGGSGTSIIPTLSNGSSIGIASLIQSLANGIGSIGVSPPSSTGGGGGSGGGGATGAIGMLSGLLSGGGGGMLGGLGGMLGGLGGMGGLGGLTNMLQQQMQQVLHYHKLDRKKGVKTSAFMEKHWSTWAEDGVTHSSDKQVVAKYPSNGNSAQTTWDQNGVTHTTQSGNITSNSQQNVQMTASNQVISQAPQIPHIGGLTTVSNVLQVGVLTESPMYNNASDRRIKNNIRDMETMLDKIMALRTRRFDEHCLQIDEHGSRYDPTKTRPMIGYVAQEVREHIKDVVFGDEEKEMLTISEGKIGVLLLKAFQEFVIDTRIEIAALKAQLNAKA